MEVILSRKNKIIVDTLNIKKEPFDSLFLDNPKLIEEAVKCGYIIKYSLICSDKSKNILDSYKFLTCYPHYFVSADLINYLSDTKSPQGIISIIEFPHNTQDICLQDNFLVLENVQDPGNVGTIIRSASGTSFKNIFMINCVNILNQKVVRSSMGGIFREKFRNFNTLQDFLDFAKKNCLNLLVASMEGESIFKISINKLKKPYGIVIGNEGNGVSENLKKIASKIISIPMKNNLESLNAGVSCSIIIYNLDNLK